MPGGRPHDGQSFRSGREGPCGTVLRMEDERAGGPSAVFRRAFVHRFRWHHWKHGWFLRTSKPVRPFPTRTCAESGGPANFPRSRSEEFVRRRTGRPTFEGIGFRGGILFPCIREEWRSSGAWPSTVQQPFLKSPGRKGEVGESSSFLREYLPPRIGLPGCNPSSPANPVGWGKGSSPKPGGRRHLESAIGRGADIFQDRLWVIPAVPDLPGKSKPPTG